MAPSLQLMVFLPFFVTSFDLEIDDFFKQIFFSYTSRLAGLRLNFNSRQGWLYINCSLFGKNLQTSLESRMRSINISEMAVDIFFFQNSRSFTLEKRCMLYATHFLQVTERLKPFLLSQKILALLNDIELCKRQRSHAYSRHSYRFNILFFQY